MHGVFTNVLWYIEFFAFAFIMIGFFCLFLYLADINHVTYSPKFDMKRNRMPNIPPVKPKPNLRLLHQRPVCCDVDCIWFCSLIGSIMTIAVCYYFAYALLRDTKLKFGIFVP